MNEKESLQSFRMADVWHRSIQFKMSTIFHAHASIETVDKLLDLRCSDSDETQTKIDKRVQNVDSLTKLWE